MYYYGNGGGCTSQAYQMPCYQPCNYGGNNSSTYAIILVLFILLVIVLGTRWNS